MHPILRTVLHTENARLSRQPIQVLPTISRIRLRAAIRHLGARRISSRIPLPVATRFQEVIPLPVGAFSPCLCVGGGRLCVSFYHTRSSNRGYGPSGPAGGGGGGGVTGISLVHNPNTGEMDAKVAFKMEMGDKSGTLLRIFPVTHHFFVSSPSLSYTHTHTHSLSLSLSLSPTTAIANCAFIGAVKKRLQRDYTLVVDKVPPLLLLQPLILPPPLTLSLTSCRSPAQWQARDGSRPRRRSLCSLRISLTRTRMVMYSRSLLSPFGVDVWVSVSD
jgi:hypothetical protein